MNPISFLIKSAATAPPPPDDPEQDPRRRSYGYWGVPAAMIGGVPIGAAGGLAVQALGEHAMTGKSGPSVTPEMYQRMAKEMGVEGMPYLHAPGAPSPAYIPPYTVESGRSSPMIRRALENQTGLPFEELEKAYNKDKGLVLGHPLDAPPEPLKPRVLEWEMTNPFTGKKIKNRVEMPNRQPDTSFLRRHNDPAIVAHELGHGSGMAPIKNKIFGIGQGLGFGLAPLLGGAYAAYQADPEESAWAGAGHGALRGAGASLIPAAPRLAEELRASLRGMSALKRMGYAGTGKGYGLLGSALGTYLLGTVVPGATSGMSLGLLGRAIKRHRMAAKLEEEDRKKQGKQAK